MTDTDEPKLILFSPDTPPEEILAIMKKMKAEAMTRAKKREDKTYEQSKE